ncbi:MAG: ribosome maturation factor RimP [Desulfovibrio sp.]|nr:ribosome maturation factor RimP [Desulfovibrio sp.]
MKSASTIERRITELAEPVVTALGLVIWGVEILHASRQILRLYVDVIPKENSEGSSPETAWETSPGASIDQCEEISRHLSLSLDVNDCIDGPYTLEVSTPGLSRIFFNLKQMSRYVGDMIEVKLNNSALTESAGKGIMPQRSHWRGILEAVDDTGFILAPAGFSVDGDVIPEACPPFRLSWTDVKKTNRVHIFKRPAKPGKKPKRNTMANA